MWEFKKTAQRQAISGFFCNMKIPGFLVVASLLVCAGCAKEGTVLKGSARLDTPDTYQPPVEITVVAKTDSTDLRLGYAADQIIFDWGMNRSELRVDGGPADGHHKVGAGYITPGKFVTVRWVVTETNQSVYVDGNLRFEHDGDYSKINRCVSVFTADKAKVTVKSIKVKRDFDGS